MKATLFKEVGYSEGRMYAWSEPTLAGYGVPLVDLLAQAVALFPRDVFQPQTNAVQRPTIDQVATSRSNRQSHMSGQQSPGPSKPLQDSNVNHHRRQTGRISHRTFAQSSSQLSNIS